MTQNADMTPRELLESYGKLLDKLFGLAQETAICRKRARNGEDNFAYWRRKAELLELEARRLNRLINLRRQQLNQMLQKLPNENHRQVLELRYISLMGYRDISKAMYTSLRQLYRYHTRGIQCLDSLINTDSIL